MVDRKRITKMLDSLLEDAGIKERLKRLKAMAEEHEWRRPVFEESRYFDGHFKKIMKVAIQQRYLQVCASLNMEGTP
jgi:hypothetical protein